MTAPTPAQIEAADMASRLDKLAASHVETPEGVTTIFPANEVKIIGDCNDPAAEVGETEVERLRGFFKLIISAYESGTHADLFCLQVARDALKDK